MTTAAGPRVHRTVRPNERRNTEEMKMTTTKLIKSLAAAAAIVRLRLRPNNKGAAVLLRRESPHFHFALQIEPRAFGAWNDDERKGSLPACLVYEMIERLIIMRWVMMKGYQPLDSRCSRKFERM
jgi:hypothetical protein